MTMTETAICGATMTSALREHVCNLPPHDDDFHRDGDDTGGTSWRVRPAVDPVDGLPHLLWSNRWNAWWGPNRSGYTNDVWQAGRYTRSEAVAEARCDAHETPPPIVAAPAPEAGVDSFTAAELAGVGELMRRRVEAATAAAIAAHTETPDDRARMPENPRCPHCGSQAVAGIGDVQACNACGMTGAAR
jgi:ribosomal protein S27AE